MAEVLGHQRAGKERRNVCKGSRASCGCRDVPQWVPICGRLEDCTAPSSFKGCLYICWVGAEGRRKADLLRPLAWSSEAEPWGRCSHHPACGVLDFPGGDSGPVPWGIHAQKAAWPATLWDWMDGKGHQRHSVLLEELPVKKRRYCQAGGGPKGGLPWPLYTPAAKLNPTFRPEGGTTHMMRPWGTLAGIGGCLHAGVKYWKAESQEHLTGGQLEGGDLGPPPTLRPELEHFLEMSMTGQGTRGRHGYPLELLIKNYELWLEWQAHQLDTPHWWEET